MPKARRIRRRNMRLVSWNVNGLRAAIRKGIDGWIDTLDADVLMLQETRVLEEQLPKYLLQERQCLAMFVAWSYLP